MARVKDQYYWNEDTINTLREEMKELSRNEVGEFDVSHMDEQVKTRFITEWIEDNCEIEDDLNYMVADLMKKMA